MTIAEFVKQFNKEQNKENFVKKHITNNYVKYAEKIARCRNIIQICCYSSIGEKTFFKINSPVKAMLLQMTLIQCYTDIEIDASDLDGYDMLMQSKVFGTIIKSIDESEIILFNSILDMMIDDEIMNTRDIVSFLETTIILLLKVM